MASIVALPSGQKSLLAHSGNTQVGKSKSGASSDAGVGDIRFGTQAESGSGDHLVQASCHLLRLSCHLLLPRAVSQAEMKTQGEDGSMNPGIRDREDW